LGRKSSLPVERADEFVNVDDGGLELDHHKRVRELVPGEKIDDATLAVDREGDLGRDGPAGLPSDLGRDSLAQCCVAGAENSV